MKSDDNTNLKGQRTLARIRRIKPFVEGSFTVTTKRCGRPGCRCAREGPIHETALLTWKEGKKTHSLYVPAALRKEVAQWVKEAKLLKRLARQMADAQRQYLILRRQNSKR